MSQLTAESYRDRSSNTKCTRNWSTRTMRSSRRSKCRSTSAIGHSQALIDHTWSPARARLSQSSSAPLLEAFDEEPSKDNREPSPMLNNRFAARSTTIPSRFDPALSSLAPPTKEGFRNMIEVYLLIPRKIFEIIANIGRAMRTCSEATKTPITMLRMLSSLSVPAKSGAIVQTISSSPHATLSFIFAAFRSIYLSHYMSSPTMTTTPHPTLTSHPPHPQLSSAL